MSTMRPHEHGEGKIQGWHRDRLAAVYVRQSSRQQVLDHGESTRLQYGLTGRAAALGWPASRVMVIDEDLGRSAANAAGRPGFARLVAELTMGHVGLVLGLEMSRLARAGRDWHQLTGLCSLAGALLAAEPFDAGSQFGVAVEEVHRHAACGGDRAEGDGLAGLGELAYPGFGAGGSGFAFGGRGLAQRGDPVLLSWHCRDLLACGRS